MKCMLASKLFVTFSEQAFNSQSNKHQYVQP